MRAVAAACLLLTGCFYLDPILPRPRSLIVRPDAITRGGLVTLSAQLVGTDNQAGSFTWTVAACSGFKQGVADPCDPAFYPPPDGPPPDDASMLSFTVPPMTMSGAKTQALQVTLDARNDRGALAQSSEDYGVGDAPPGVQLDLQSHSLAIGAPIDLIATVSDVDSALDGVTLAWTANAPGSMDPFPLQMITVAQDPADPGHRKEVMRLVPTTLGDWNVKVKATDAEGGSTTQALRPITVVPDAPPCLRQWLPTVPPPGATLPISAPTAFQVPLVDDDLDPYPPISGDPKLVFAWSVLRPGAAQREVQSGATGNTFQLDPAVYTPGDVIELRVEIYDRQRTALPCDDAAATCSIVSSDRCLQRQTWRVEVR